MYVQRRLASKLTRVVSWQFKNVRMRNDSLEIVYENGGKREQLIMPFVWLRDHCSSQKCYHAPTNQRKSNCSDLFSRAKIKEKKQVTWKEDTALCIDWDDGHRSTFELADILQKALPKRAPKLDDVVQLWDSKLDRIPRISSLNLELKKFSENLVKYGVVVIEDVEGTPEATEELCKKLVPVHDTFFGQFWVFSNNASEDEPAYEDTAYGNEGIGPHTDGTYFNQAPGIQVFHCLQPAKTGGDTVLVDAFFCAKKLRDENPEMFETLCETKITHHYLEGSPPGSSIHSVSLQKPAIEKDSFGNIAQVRFNPYDRAPFNCLSSSEFSAEQAMRFYEAYERFSQLCHDPENAIQTSLRPGSVIFIDNYRVLHSRTAFQGYRRMCGCYLSRDNFYAKARPFLPTGVREFM